MLQLPDVGKSGEVQGCNFSPISSGVYGECSEVTAGKLGCLTVARSKQVILPVPAQAESRIGVPRSEMSMI